jgi:hypothetical protein
MEQEKAPQLFEAVEAIWPTVGRFSNCKARVKKREKRIELILNKRVLSL